MEHSSVENQGVARADGRLEAMGDISEHDPDAAPASRMCSCARHGLRDVVDAGHLPTPAGQGHTPGRAAAAEIERLAVRGSFPRSSHSDRPVSVPAKGLCFRSSHRWNPTDL